MAGSPLYRAPRLDTTRLASVLFESLLFGYFCASFFRCIVILRKRARARSESMFCMPVFLLGCVLFCTIAGQLVVEIIQAFKALIIPRNFDWNPVHRNEGFTPAELSYAIGHIPLNIACSALYAITMLLADGFLVTHLSYLRNGLTLIVFSLWIHRMYLICRRNLTVTIPALILLAALTAACTMVIRDFGDSRDIFGNARPWVLIVFALTFLCNLYCAIFIACRIRSSQKQVAGSEALARSSIDKISNILIQSAGLYCLLVVLSLVLIAINSNVVYFTIDITSPIIGIIFSSIVTRTHDHVKLHGKESTASSSNPAVHFANSGSAHNSPNPSIQNHFSPPSPV